MNFDQFKTMLQDSANELLEQLDVRAEFISFVESQRANIEAYIAAGDQAQLQVMAFRFRTWARGHALEAVRAAEQKVWAIAFTALRFALAVPV